MHSKAGTHLPLLHTHILYSTCVAGVSWSSHICYAGGEFGCVVGLRVDRCSPLLLSLFVLFFCSEKWVSTLAYIFFFQFCELLFLRSSPLKSSENNYACFTGWKISKKKLDTCKNLLASPWLLAAEQWILMKCCLCLAQRDWH